MHSGVYFYSKLAPEVGDIIKQHDRWPEIVEWEYSDEPLMEVKSNADRRGYFLYQKSNGKFNQQVWIKQFFLGHLSQRMHF
jgi:hypothetical protein